MSREIIDLESDTTFGVSRDYKEKDLIIEDLNKKIRFIKFESDKRIKSLECELEEYKEKMKNMGSQQNNKSYQQITMELEHNLTVAENELMNCREIENQLKKQIVALKTENLSLKSENEKMDKLRDDSLELEELRFLKQNLEEFQNKVKEGAIEAIMEKEKELAIIKEKLEDSEVIFNAQISSLNNEIQTLQEKLFKSGMFLRDSEEIQLPISNSNQIDIIQLKKQFEIERAEFNERLNILSIELEDQAALFDNQKKTFENEINEKVHQKLKEQLEATSNMESNLLEELQKYDDQLRNYESSTKELEKKLKFQEEKHSKYVDSLKKRIDELEKTLENNELQSKKHDKIGDKFKEELEELRNKVQEDDNVIKSMEKLKQKEHQKILQLEGENKKLLQLLEKLKTNQQTFDNQKIEFEEKIKSLMKENEDLKNESISNKMPFHKISEDKEPENTGGLFEIRVTKPRPTTTFTSLSLSNELKGLEDENFFEQSDFIINNRTPAGPENNVKCMKFPPAFDIRKFSCMEKSPDEALVKKINQLEAENDRLKKEIESLNENLLQEFEKQKTKEVLITQQQQSRRRQSLLGLQLIPQEILEKLKEEGLISDTSTLSLETFEKVFKQFQLDNSAKKELENKYLKLKREYDEEKIFLEEELKHAEEAAIDAKLKFAIIATEKDYFEHEHKLIINELKKQKIEIEYDDGKKRQSKFFDMFLCSCKTN